MISRFVCVPSALTLILALAGCNQPTAQPSATATRVAHSTATATATATTASTPTTPVPPPPATTSLASARLNGIVDRVLRAQYSDGFDAAHGCWKAQYGDGDDALPYCMRPLPAGAVMENGDQVIYIATASASDVEADAYRYGATDPGMFDAFRVLVAADGTPSLTSSIRGMDFGSAGDCGCANADFVQLGPNVHGWVFSSGSTQQGITTATHALVAPLGRTFVDVGNIPQYVEGDQDIEYRLTLGSENASDGWFPITVSKYRNDRRIASQVARFDRNAKRYVVRQSF